jgi:NitT/TauT family transport system substrate-binding protein
MMRRRTLFGRGLNAVATPVRAEAQEVRLSHGYGIHYLPMMVIRDQKLLEKYAAKAGLGTGAPGFITLWARAHNVPASAVVGVTALGGGALWLNSNKASIKTLRDFGLENYAKLDPLTVSLSHPDALAVLTSGKTEVDAHFASPPFSNQELTFPNVHRVSSTADIFGPITVDVSYAPKRFADANPGLIGAFIAAMDEADAFIAAGWKGAADAFVRVSGVKMAADTIDAMPAAPETKFRTAPDGVMAYANYLAAAGLIKVKPASWSELFVPQLQSRTGS